MSEPTKRTYRESRAPHTRGRINRRQFLRHAANGLTVVAMGGLVSGLGGCTLMDGGSPNAGIPAGPGTERATLTLRLHSARHLTRRKSYRVRSQRCAVTRPR